MNVNVHLMGSLSEIQKDVSEILLPEGACVRDLLESLGNRYGEEFNRKMKHLEVWQISLNGNLHLLATSAETVLNDHDQVTILPLLFGG